MNTDNPISRGWTWLRQGAIDAWHMPPELTLAPVIAALAIIAGIVAVIWLFRQHH